MKRETLPRKKPLVDKHPQVADWPTPLAAFAVCLCWLFCCFCRFFVFLFFALLGCVAKRRFGQTRRAPTSPPTAGAKVPGSRRRAAVEGRGGAAGYSPGAGCFSPRGGACGPVGTGNTHRERGAPEGFSLCNGRSPRFVRPEREPGAQDHALYGFRIQSSLLLSAARPNSNCRQGLGEQARI